jgi:hypothetical protein
MKISLLLLLTKVGARDDTGIDDIRRFFIVPATDSRQAGRNLGTEMEPRTHGRIKEKVQRAIHEGRRMTSLLC